MDSHVWRIVYQAVRTAGKQAPRGGRKPTYSDTLIVAMYLWTVLHDRPLCWACDRSNYASCFRPRRLPSVSQFCKRMKTDRVARLLQRAYDLLLQRSSCTLSMLDGRALPVSPHSKDADAKRGRASGGYARGYKLHAWATPDGQIPRWCVTSLNVNEKRAAAELFAQHPPVGLVLADGEYDSGRLFEQAEAGGGQLLAPLPKNAGKGHRRQSPARLRAVFAWRGIAGYVYKERGSIERTFAHLSAFGGGLAPLPAWVRTLPRVRRWVGGKLIIYHARLLLRKQRQTKAS